MGKRAKKRRTASGADFYDGKTTNPYRGVSGGMRAGKRKRGASTMSGTVKQRKTRAVTGNVTREMLANAPSGAMAEITKRGVVKTLHYVSQSVSH
jgi:hypothetical protein